MADVAGRHAAQLIGLAEEAAILRSALASERAARAEEARQREEVIRQELEARSRAKRDREEARRQKALSESEVVQEILGRLPREDLHSYISRVDRAMRRLGFSEDAWYSHGASLYDYNESEFYTLIVSPKVGR